MNLDTMEMSEQELKQLEIELDTYLDDSLTKEENEFAVKHYAGNDFELVIGFYSGFKAALYTTQRYPELLKEKEDEKKE